MRAVEGGGEGVKAGFKFPVSSFEPKDVAFIPRPDGLAEGYVAGQGRLSANASISKRRAVRYGLTSQIRRVVVSIPRNVAERQVRLSKREFKQFLGIARASLLELETQLFIAKDLDYLKQGELEDLLARTSELLKMLNGLISSISPN